MASFLKKLLGTTARSRAAELEHERSMRELEQRDKELGALHLKLVKMSEAQKDKENELSKTKIDLTTTLSSVPPKLCEVEETDDRPSGEQAPPG